MNVMEEVSQCSLDLPEVLLVHRQLQLHDRQVLVALGVAASQVDLIAEQRIFHW
jgi:hypothetical protein